MRRTARGLSARKLVVSVRINVLHGVSVLLCNVLNEHSRKARRIRCSALRGGRTRRDAVTVEEYGNVLTLFKLTNKVSVSVGIGVNRFALPCVRMLIGYRHLPLCHSSSIAPHRLSDLAVVHRREKGKLGVKNGIVGLKRNVRYPCSLKKYKFSVNVVVVNSLDVLGLKIVRTNRNYSVRIVKQGSLVVNADKHNRLVMNDLSLPNRRHIAVKVVSFIDTYACKILTCRDLSHIIALLFVRFILIGFIGISLRVALGRLCILVFCIIVGFFSAAFPKRRILRFRRINTSKKRSTHSKDQKNCKYSLFHKITP